MLTLPHALPRATQFRSWTAADFHTTTAVDAPKTAHCSCDPSGSPPSDAALVAGCLRGNAKCWKALVQRYQRLLFAIVRRIGLDEHTADVTAIPAG
jgi:hypothetical protein